MTLRAQPSLIPTQVGGFPGGLPVLQVGTAPFGGVTLPVPVCKGTCPQCGGSGTRTCPFCNGRGCSMCNGGTVNCPDCGGSGQR